MSAPASKSTYFKVWLTLMLLLFLTWGTARFDLGIANPIAALVIAVGKALLVILFFMQVRSGSRLIRLFAGAGFLWLLIMLALTMTDYLTRRTVMPYSRERDSTTESRIQAARSPAPREPDRSQQ
jgi:cytochrome c oxidase subunit 4